MKMETENLYISSLQLYAESLVHQIGEFHYELEADQIFLNWFGKCGDVSLNDLAHVPNEEKVSQLLWRLGAAEWERLTCFDRSKTISDITFDETVLILFQLFGERSSELRNCSKCLSPKSMMETR
ncbi:unnamed protein product [Hymenolepis diminuta]|uniref:DUF7083 domain-containing protein n=1 Tax=Hymenolepis diminuta TaxID=6216 RepID=A0A564Z1M5_HYMDI|nr:unnamed protein product [Hymenolepis diminuta]